MNYAGKFGSGELDSHSAASVDIDSLSHHGSADTVTIPDAHLLFGGDYERSGSDLIVSDHDHRVVVSNYFQSDKHPTLVSPDGAPLDPKVIEALTGHVQYAQASGAAAAAKVVGHVIKMTGSASVVRNGVAITLNDGENVLQNDVVQTGSGSTIGLVMIDGTTFNLSAGARLMLNDLTYDANSTSNTSLFTLVQGAASFVAGQVAKTGDMKVGTPVATMGIRGTAVILDISAVDGKVSISVVDQRDGQVHSVQVFNSRGILIGTVTSSGSGLTLTPIANFEVIAQASDKSVAQITQEFNAFQTLLQTYDAGRVLFPNLPQHTDANPQSPTRYASSTPATSNATEYHAPVDSGTVGQTGGTPTAIVFTSSLPTDTAPIGSTKPPPSDSVVLQQTVSVIPIPFVVTPASVSPITSGPGDHSGPVMSASGDVVYDPDGIIYFYDRASGVTTRVTPAGDGFTYGGQTISSDGRFIVYQGSDGTHSYVFVWGTDPADPAHYHQQTQLASGTSPAISGDGSTILVEQGGAIAIYDLQGNAKGTITPAAIGTTGTLWKPAISADGHVIAFWSSDSASAGGSGHLYTYDLSTGVVTEIASTAAGAGTTAASISADGHFVVYQGTAPGGHSEIYLYDLTTGHVVFSTVDAPETLTGASRNAVISPDGHFIIFTSDAQLTGDDGNAFADTYIVDVTHLEAPVYKLVSALGEAASDGGVAISAGGQYVAFASNATFSGGSGAGSNIFVADSSSGHSAIIQETASSPASLTATGTIGITGGVSGVTLTVTDQFGNPTSVFGAGFDANGNIKWNFAEAKADFASLPYGQDASQHFIITLSSNGGSTTIPVTVTVHNAVQPAVTPADVAPVAAPVALADGTEDTAFTITSAALLAGVGDIDTLLSQLHITDVTIKSGGGSVTANENGTWTYVPAADFNGAVAFNYTVSDGTKTASSTASLHVAAVNDAATIDGNAGGTVVEDSSTITSGALTVHDVDSGENHFQAVSGPALVGTYGNFTFNANTGTWTYALDHTRADSLTAGQVVHDKLTVTSADGTASQIIDVAVSGSNDAATISGQATGTVVEDTSTTTSGSLTIHDVDRGEATFQAVPEAALAGHYGNFTFNAGTGTWTYALNHDLADGLAKGQTVHDTLTVTSADGTASRVIDVTVVGSAETPGPGVTTLTFDDLPAVSGSGSAVPDGYGGLDWLNFYYLNSTNYPVSGYTHGTVSAPNVAYNSFGATATVSGDTFNFIGADLTGAWNNGLSITVTGFNHGVLVDQETVVVNTYNPTWFEFDFNGITDLVFSSSGGTDAGYGGAGVHFVMDNFEYSTSVNNAATIAGDAAGSLVEDDTSTDASGNVIAHDVESGTLTVHDVDSGENHFRAVVPATLAGHYGNFTFDENTGAWTYTLVHAQADSLTAGQLVHDTLTVTSVDGTASRVIDVAITGSNDAPVAVADTGVSITQNGGVGVSFSPILSAHASGVGSEYVITQAVNSQAGALWSNSKVSLNTSFTISAELFFGANDGGADGFSFIIQNQSKNLIGASGGGLGYQGIANSVAIEFDTYDNGAGSNDIPDDHAAFDVNGSMSGLGKPIDLGNIEDNQYHPVTIDWNAATHVITLSYNGHVIGSQTIDVAAIVGSGEAYIGFAGSTGAANNLQMIRDLTYQSADDSVVLDVLVNDTDVDAGDKATLHVVSAASAGGASVTFSGLPGAGIVYSPGGAFDYLAAGQTTTDTVRYTVQDSHGASSTTTAQVTIHGLNDAPVITGTTATGSVPSSALTATAASYLTAGPSLVNGLGETRGFGEAASFGGSSRTDDGSTSAIDLTDVFGASGLNFFGHTYTSLYINNNGNVTFVAPSSTFTPATITSGSSAIIAPFWADVDTRSPTGLVTPGGNSTGSDLVYYHLDSVNHAVTITWDDVGYFNQHDNLANAFQLQLIGLGNGDFDIVFRYEAVNWTTGDASSGSGGLGGTPARAGYSAGDGNPNHYFEIPGSGSQQMLALDTTTGNTAVTGVDIFQVQSGNVTSAPIANGTVQFADPDRTDTHTASFTAGGTGYHGTFTLDPVSETGGNGSVAWHFALTNVEVNNIAIGVPLVQNYTIAVNDGHAGITTQTVSVAVGSAGADTLNAGHAADVLIGAGGNDNFAFSSTSVDNETIVDFTHGADLLQISVAGAGFAGHGLVANHEATVINAASFGAATGGTTNGDFIFDTTSHSLYWDANGGSGADAVLLAHLQNVNSLSATDFHLV